MILIKPKHEILTDINGDKILQRIEAAGRTCYKSEAKITPESARPFVERIMKSGHHSVIEHESLSVRFICDRGVTHEIVRHRIAAYSQESTRYCNYSGGVYFVIPPWIDCEPGPYSRDSVHDVDWDDDAAFEGALFMCDCEQQYKDMLDAGWSPQEARSVLPNSLKTEIVMTTNLREWQHVLKLRTSPAAHPQMRELMVPLRLDLTMKIPVLFDMGGE